MSETDFSDTQTQAKPLSSPTVEASVLSILLAFPDAFDDHAPRLKPAHFADALHRSIFAELVRQMATGKGCDLVTLSEGLRDTVSLQKLHEIALCHDFSARAVGSMVDTLIDRYQSRQLHRLSQKMSTLAFGDGPAQERIAQAHTALETLETSTDEVDEWVDSHAAAIAHLDLIDARQAGKIKGLETGLPDFDNLLDGGMQRGNLVVIGARPSMGKAQPLHSKILTTKGWSCMGDMEVGCELASIDGENSIVTGVFSQGNKQVFLVTFTDGRKTECCDEHLWKVNHRKWNEPKILSTGQLRNLLAIPSMSGRLWIDAPSGNFGVQSELPVDPWLFGALLGDGDLTQKTIRFSSQDEQILDLVRNALPPPVILVHAGGCDWRLSGEVQHDHLGLWEEDSNPLTKAVRKLGLMGCKSETKFIPECYLLADRVARLGVLRGLMDTDGWVEKHGSVLLSSASMQLAKDVQYLARSLGYWCSMREKPTSYKKNGESHSCQTAYVLTISGNGIEEIFLFDRKRDRCKDRVRGKSVVFSSITPSGVMPCQCISVSHKSSLYITDDFVVTHNTALGMTIGLHMARSYAVGLLSMEMPHNDVRDRQAAILSSASISSIKRPSNGLDYDRIVEGVERSKHLRFFVSDKSGQTIAQVRSKARMLHRKHALDVLIVDYIGLMPGTDPKQNRAYQIEEITHGLKALAKDLSIVVVALAQVNRGSAERTDTTPGLHDLRDSGAIEQDADVVAFVHRPIQLKPDLGAQWANYALLRVAKNRQGRCGDVHLHYQGQYTRFGSWAGPIPSKTVSKTQPAKRGFDDDAY